MSSHGILLPTVRIVLMDSSLTVVATDKEMRPSIISPKEGIEMRPKLRLYTGEDDFETPSSVTISFGELRRIIEDANGSERTWLRDFSCEDVQIPEDLYDVLKEYARLRPGA